MAKKDMNAVVYLEPVGSAYRRDLGRRTVPYNDLTLFSAFQPIYSLSHMRPAGYEALLRAHDHLDRTVSPLEVFGDAARHHEAGELDRITRTLHLESFVAQRDEHAWLFLNVHTDTLSDERHAAVLLSECRRIGIRPEQVVLEILQHSEPDLKRLANSIALLREHGFVVALTEFGAGHSNIDRVWQFRPDIVKLDRNMIQQAANNSNVERILGGLIALLHDAGKLVLVEGVETATEALIAIDCNADLVQGYHLGRPAGTVADSPSGCAVMNELALAYRSRIAQREERQHKWLAEHITAFEFAASRMASGLAASEACGKFLALSASARCYVLDAHGRQMDANLAAPPRLGMRPSRFSPLADGAGASWERRPYFRRAINEPGRIQVSRPYLSLNGAHACITLSIALTAGGATLVLCGDIDCSDAQQQSGFTAYAR
jgi:EAL domain-containing protein (putative c-di-GMP-specific phosphodiesterase class I)